MGSVEKRPSGRWRARWREDDGTQRAMHFATKGDAERHLVTVSADLLRGDYISPEDSQTLFGEYAGQWAAAQIHRASTAQRTEILIRRHMTERWGRRRLGSIRPTEVQAWVRELSKTLAPATTSSVYAQFATIMGAAVTDRLINRSPCVRISVPKPEKERVVPLPVDVVATLSEKIQAEHRAALAISAMAGLRISECLGLTWDRIDFLGRTITVDRQMVAVPDGWEFGPPKTRASNRVIPVGDVLLEELAAHQIRFGAGECGLITNVDGSAVTRRRLSGSLKRAMVKVPDCPAGTTWHDLRHFYASVLIDGGASVAAVQARLGHASAAETLGTYTHLFPAEDDRTRGVIDRAFRPAELDDVDRLRTKDA